jgi:CO/xanthine dehydrogenase Mo-binding subunit
MIVGKLVETSAVGLKQILEAGGFLRAGYDAEEFRRACRAYTETVGPLRVFTRYEQPADVNWDDQLYRGDAYSAFAWAAYVAEVSVDTSTFEARVEDFVAVQEVGRVIHPVLAAGQIEGGVAQGIGWSLYECVAWREGRMANGQMTNYIIPTAADVPPIRVHFFENPFPGGPAGAKGIGELPMDGPAPAILNAVEHATGIAFDHVPLTPEEIMEAMEASRQETA